MFNIIGFQCLGLQGNPLVIGIEVQGPQDCTIAGFPTDSCQGLDEIGFKGAGNSGDDSAGAALTLGKRLSKDLYVTYEQSLNGAMGTLYIFYELSRRLTLRAQTGVQTAVDLIYTMRRD